MTPPYDQPEPYEPKHFSEDVVRLVRGMNELQKAIEDSASERSDLASAVAVLKEQQAGIIESLEKNASAQRQIEKAAASLMQGQNDLTQGQNDLASAVRKLRLTWLISSVVWVVILSGLFLSLYMRGG